MKIESEAMKNTRGLVLLFIFGAMSIVHAQTPKGPSGYVTLETLAWLEGSWHGDFEGNPLEAHYTSPDGGEILGMSKEFLKDGRCWFEYERFTQSADTLKVTPYPRGEKSVSFVLTGYDPSIKKAVFENKAHDFPTDITYELIAPDSLRILVAGPGKDGRKVLTVNLARKK